MPAKLILRDQTYEAEDGLTVKEALVKLGLEPQLYIAVRDGKLVTDDQKILPDDKLKLIAVISGGNL